MRSERGVGLKDEESFYVASQPVRREIRRTSPADAESDDRRGWLSHGLAALGISALGLAIAASVSLTTSAQPLPVKEPTKTASTASRTDAGAVAPTEGKPDKSEAAALRAFTPRGGLTVEGAAGSAALRTAVLKEQAAQRAEELAKAADDITRAASTASSDARQSRLSAADRASREAAVRLNEARIKRAVAARLAAAAERETQERTERAAPAREVTQPDVSTSIPSSGGSASPVPGAVIGAHFGQYGVWSRYHTGLDFRAAYGTPIRAVKAGEVLFAGNSGDWAGNHVAIRHGDGRTTMSSHMSSMAVRSGQTVAAGQVIGYVGQTGRAFGAHLHFELYPVGVRYGDVYKAIDPQPWLAANGVQTR
jgi:murein DD-endopeptidase MepM/ murein hydrolase activator NlpD